MPLGPTAVLLLAGYASATDSPPALWVAAFVAQIVADVGFSTVRAWVASGVRPELHLRVLGWIALIDAPRWRHSGSWRPWPRSAGCGRRSARSCPR